MARRDEKSSVSGTWSVTSLGRALPRSAVALALGAVLGALSGCDCAGPGRGGVGDPCTSGSECIAGLTCVDGRCRPLPDAGPLPDGAVLDAPGADVPGLDAPALDAPSACSPACGAGQRCDTSGATPTCLDNLCSDLTCSPTERCAPAPAGTGNVCVSNACSDSADCPLDRYCDGTICQPDACVPGETSCDSSGGVLTCPSDGAPATVRFTCGGGAYFTSVCSTDAGGAFCPCEDDWDCPAFTLCEAGRCDGTGRAPTCRLPAAAFSTALPAPEPGFPWGGASIAMPDAPATTPFPQSTQVVMTPLVVNLDDDNGDGRIDERDYAEIVFLTFRGGGSISADGVLRAVHGGGPNRGRDFFASCGATVWHEGDPLTATCGATAGVVDSTAGLAAGDIDGDGVPEIVAVSETDRVQIYSNTGVLLLDLGGAAIAGNGSPTIANVDGTGLAEVVLGAHVFTFEHPAGGALGLVDRFDGTLGQGSNGQGPISCIANVAGGSELEVIASTTAYRMPAPPAGVTRRSMCAGGDTSDFCAGRLTVVWDAQTVNGAGMVPNREGFCAVADVLGATRAMPPSPANPLDGSPEIVVVSNGRLYIYAGDTGVIARNIDLAAATTRGGAPNVDDFDGDGFPEIGLAGALRFEVMDLQPTTTACPAWPTARTDLAANPNPPRAAPTAACASDADCGDTTQFVCNTEIGACVCLHNGWQALTEDDSSQVTGSTVFDFNGDGAAEVVYNDECYFRVYSGLDGTVLFRDPSESRTRTENAVVADVDNDGNAEIVFPTSTESGFCDNSRVASGYRPGIEVWGDTTDLWVSARRVWNEHAYHVTNVLESGGIPVREPESWVEYGGREYNTYRSQPRSFGIAPNVVVTRVQLSSPGATCGTLGSTLEITVRVENRGDVRVGADVEVDFTGIWDTPALTEPLYADAAMTPLRVTLGVPLDPGASTFLTVTYDATTSSPGVLPNRIRVTVDPAMRERECIETDNSMEVPVEAGALVADLEVELSAHEGDCPVITFPAVVRNAGAVAASDIVVRFYAGDPATGGSVLHEETIAGPLAPGGMVTVRPAIAIPDREIEIFVVVDPDDTIPECNDGNNVDSTGTRFVCII